MGASNQRSLCKVWTIREEPQIKKRRIQAHNMHKSNGFCIFWGMEMRKGSRFRTMADMRIRWKGKAGIEDLQWGCRVVDGVRAESEDGAVEEVEDRHSLSLPLPPFSFLCSLHAPDGYVGEVQSKRKEGTA